ncbi:hypothetical protein XENTR_v10010222 [Xenopus tropicalis]|uniref:Uncharacterized protein LOC116409837 n=1 Tax=Xenopus tropicalis TaxID=8364 RepID=A0A8J1JBZ5_XENTR|nr:uncharacterized protein LOC116409837 [Xenopus tropicalis]KAE8620398.1 hypothetical protein XENTR_v10010222 [Xenopus tropicalis]
MEECGICVYQYGPGREAQALAGCVHMVCTSCLRHMAGTDGTVTCPYCRARCALPSNLRPPMCGRTEKGRSRRSWVKKLFQPTKRRQGTQRQGNIGNVAVICPFFL